MGWNVNGMHDSSASVVLLLSLPVFMLGTHNDPPIARSLPLRGYYTLTHIHTLSTTFPPPSTHTTYTSYEITFESRCLLHSRPDGGFKLNASTG